MKPLFYRYYNRVFISLSPLISTASVFQVRSLFRVMTASYRVYVIK